MFLFVNQAMVLTGILILIKMTKEYPKASLAEK